MYAPTAPNTMSGKGAGPQKKSLLLHTRERTPFGNAFLVKFCSVDGSLFGSRLFMYQVQKRKVPNWERTTWDSRKGRCEREGG